MENILVSVVIPTYNSAKYIRQAIDSVFDQAVELEVIVIDDASSDETIEILNEYKTRKNFIVIKNEKNLGVAASRNIGVQKASGEFVAFLDADDWWEPSKLTKQLIRMRETQTVLCSTARELVDDSGKSNGRIIGVKEHITYRMMLYQNWLNCSSVLVKTEVIKRFPMQYDDSHEDYITWVGILKEYNEACGVNEPLLKYRVSSAGKSGTKQKSAKMMYRAYRHLGMGHFQAAFYFCIYAINGIRKHYLN